MPPVAVLFNNHQQHVHLGAVVAAGAGAQPLRASALCAPKGIHVVETALQAAVGYWQAMKHAGAANGACWM